jgi:eukaryotic-like serine/threonine-protein kinase
VPHAPDLSGIALDGRYELHAVIGEGTFGRVYRGRDRRLARQVAVKVIKPWWAEDPDWVQSFEREAQLLASVSDPGIVQIFDVGSAPEGIYYVAELVQGQSLAHRLRSGPLAPAEAAEVAEQLSRALAHAHGQRVVHRDVKPANVLLSPDGRVKVGDFGVARLAEGSSDGVGATIVGTPRYMAPEQARGGPITPATDVYGVGVVLYEMLTGHPPFDGSTAVELALHHVNDPPPPLPGDLPPAIVRVTERALAKTPADRYADGGELAHALAEARVSNGEAEVAHGQTGNERAAPAPTAADATPAPRPDATRVGQPMSPRRIVNPSERRQRIALFGLVLVLAFGMVAAAIALAPGHVKVPDLRGMNRMRVAETVRNAGLRTSFSRSYDPAPPDTAIGQAPAAGRRVQDGTTVRVLLSAGPAPVPVPQLVGLPTAAARAKLSREGLRATITEVPAPLASTGTVTRAVPPAGTKLRPGSSVALSVAQAPRWRPLTGFAGQSSGRSVPFRIFGRTWQVVYSMAYRGTCTFVLFCSGPSATVKRVSDGATIDSFSLDEGTGKTREVKAPPGIYEISVSPGSDTAQWSIQVQDRY